MGCCPSLKELQNAASALTGPGRTCILFISTSLEVIADI